MTKLMYLAAMALLGLGLTMAQSTSTASDPSNSSQANQTQNTTAPNNQGVPQTGTDPKLPSKGKRDAHQGAPDTTIRDHQGSTTSTTGASGQSETQPSTSTMGTTGSTPGTETSEPADKTSTSPQTGTPPDQQPNSSTTPGTPTPRLVMNDTPGARAMATHTPDPGTCMNPAAMDGGQAQVNTSGSQRRAPACD